MKALKVLIILSLTFNMSCNRKKNSDIIASYEYNAKVELNDTLQQRVGHWIKEGDICYGLVVSSFSNNRISLAKPVKAKVLNITNNAIKMKALETVNVGVSEKAKACGKLQIDKGQTWWEKDGDLFQSLEEAEAFANKLNNTAKSYKFTID